MLSLVLAFALANPGYECPFNAVCAHGDGTRPVSVTITISATIVSAHAVSMTTYPMELEGAYKVVTTGITTGIKDSKWVEETYLVWDQLPGPGKDPVMFTWNEVEFIPSTKYDEVLVMKWSEAHEALARISDIIQARQKKQIQVARHSRKK